MEASQQDSLLCALHTRVGVTDEQVPSWVTLDRAARIGGTGLMTRRTLLAGAGNDGRAGRGRPDRALRRRRRLGLQPARQRAHRRLGAGREGHGRPQHLRRPDPGRGPRVLLPRAGEDRQRRGRPAGRGRGHHRRRLRGQDRLPAGQLPRDHAHGRARVRDQDPPDAGEADGQPSRDQRPGLLGGLRPRPGDRGRAGDREGGPEGRDQALRRGRDALPALLVHARVRARVHAPEQRQHRAGAADVRAARLRRRARLLTGRLPRLLVRDQRHRLDDEAQGRRDRSARTVRCAARGVRAAVLVPGVPGDRDAASASSPRRTSSSSAAASTACSARRA